MTSLLFSVVVCTYNRSEILKIALESLCQQTLTSDEYEIVVVDNNSTDNTRQIVQSFMTNQPIKHVIEENIGLSNARNRGYREAKGLYIAYCDDDCKLPAQWLANAKKTVEAYHPDLFGGPYLPFYLVDKPTWFKDDYGAGCQHGILARSLNGNEYLSGGNFFIKKTILEKLGGFDPHAGMTGDKIWYAEETILQKIFRSRFPQHLIYYDPDVYVQHLVRPEKLSIRWWFRSRFIAGRAMYLTYDHQQRSWISFILWILRAYPRTFFMISLRLTILTLFRNRKKYTNWRNYWKEVGLESIFSLGKIVEQTKHQFNGLRA